MGQVQQQVASESSAECASAKEMLEVRSLIQRESGAYPLVIEHSCGKSPLL